MFRLIRAVGTAWNDAKDYERVRCEQYVMRVAVLFVFVRCALHISGLLICTLLIQRCMTD